VAPGLFEAFLTSISPEISHVLSAICVHMNRNVLVISSIFSNMKDFLRSQPVTYTVDVVISQKRCKMKSLLLQTTNRK